MLYEEVQKKVGHDTFELFGDTGTGKTTFALELVKEYVAKGKKVLYVDSEKNLLSTPKGVDYKYVPSFDDMYSVFIKKETQMDAIKDHIEKALAIKTKYDLIVLDSMGLPVLGKFALMDLRNRGNILLACEAVSMMLKYYCNKNKCTALVLNQPQSDMGKNMYSVLKPFGEKSAYFYKEIWKSRATHTGPDETVLSIEAFRSRSHGRKTKLFEMSITDSGAKITSLIGKAKEQPITLSPEDVLNGGAIK